MKTLQEIIKTLPVTQGPNKGSMYCFSDLKCALESVPGMQIGVGDAEFLKPFYIQDDKILEIYWCELSVYLVDRYDFEGYLLRLTGAKSVQDISEWVIELHKQCHIEVLREKPSVPADRILQYVDYVLLHEQIAEDVIHAYSHYNKEKLMFSYFHLE